MGLRLFSFTFLVALVVSGPLFAAGGGPISVEGVLREAVDDDFASQTSATSYELLTDTGEVVPLATGGAALEGVRSGTRVRVSGRLEGGWLMAERVEPLQSPADEALTLSAWTTGAKRVLVILLNFKDDTSQPYTVSQVQSTLFGATGSVAAYYAETSYGATSMSGDIAGWYTATVNKPTTCDTGTIQTQAENAATSHGYVLGNYNFEVYVFPKVSACGWAGLAYVGWSGAWINQAVSTYVVGHELGHNYGLLHAHSLDCGAVPYGATCTRSEYGDPYDIMGGAARQFNAYSKQYLAWLPAGTLKVLSSGSSTVVLSPLESPTGATRAVELQTASGPTYWLEWRQAIGFDSGLGSNSNVMNGLLVHIGPSAVGGTDLLDMTPDGSTSNATFGDAALTVGNTYTDISNGLAVTPVVINGSTLTVNIQYGVAPPISSFTFAPASPKAGQAVSFSDTSTGEPSSFSWDFGDGATSTLENPIHSYSAAGSYSVSLVVSNGAGTSAPATHAVTVAPATPLALYTLTPCRVVDTRSTNGPLGGPALAAGKSRSFVVAGHCGIPSDAAAVSANVTVTQPVSAGFLQFSPGTSAINFRNSQTRANNAILALGSQGDVTVTCAIPSGSVQFILDVNGYYK
jgi:PKD repeat protein